MTAIETVSADIAARISAMAQDSPLNNATVIANLIRDQIIPAAQGQVFDAIIRHLGSYRGYDVITRIRADILKTKASKPMTEDHDLICKTCHAGYYLLSGYCNHCNSVQAGSGADIMEKRICFLERELEHEREETKTLKRLEPQLAALQFQSEADRQSLERENAELKAQREEIAATFLHACGAAGELRLKDVRLREALIAISTDYEGAKLDHISPWRKQRALEALSETSADTAKTLLGPTLELLKRVDTEPNLMPELQLFVRREINRLKKLCQ